MKICKTCNFFFFLLSVLIDKSPVEALTSTKWGFFCCLGFVGFFFSFKENRTFKWSESMYRGISGNGIRLPHLVCMQYSLLSRLKEKGSARASTEQMGAGLAKRHYSDNLTRLSIVQHTLNSKYTLLTLDRKQKSRSEKVETTQSFLLFTSSPWALRNF